MTNTYRVIVRWTADGAPFEHRGIYGADTFDDAVELARAGAGYPCRPEFEGCRLGRTERRGVLS